MPFLAPLAMMSRHGRLALPLGLVAGICLPEVAMAVKPWLPELVLLLLFVSSFRIAGPMLRQEIAPGRQAVFAVLTLQLFLPLAVLGVVSLLGLSASPVALAVLLMLSAPSVTGAPNFTILLGHDPAPGFRLLILGTFLLPVTMTPIFLGMPALGDLAASLSAALKLLVSIAVTVGLALALRRVAPPRLSTYTTEALDGATVLLLVIMVLGLMSALGPALRQAPLVVFGWLTLAVGLNFGLQTLTFCILKTGPLAGRAVPYAVVAGNRNVALFLVSLPESTMEQLLIFLGCYQVPMYLTPLVMRRVYGERS